jgi:hypothetical protein
LALCFVFSYLWLLIKDPDRLQSERYRLQKQQLEILEVRYGNNNGLKEIEGATAVNKLGFEQESDL